MVDVSVLPEAHHASNLTKIVLVGRMTGKKAPLLMLKAFRSAYTRYVPESFRRIIRPLRRPLRIIYYYGKAKCCPVCGVSARKFGTFGRLLREDARCLHCGALERHRLVWLYFQRRTNLFDGKPKAILHIAPEACFQARLQAKFGPDYITADLFDPRAMVKMDITRIPFPENTFNIIYCSHVLEHVPDDKKAMRELHRVLKNTGWAIILVPITAAQTIEDPLESDPEERLKRFGQEDHVRQYGSDYIDRLRAASFSVDRISPTDFLSEFERQQMGITGAAGDIYYCRKHD